jgi:ribosome-binding factor A
MPKEFSRSRRVAEQIQRELAVLIQQELKDPRLGMLTISAVEVSKDMSTAKVFITVFNEEQDRKNTLEALEHATGFLQHELGRLMSLRIIPKLRFVYDESVVRGAELSALIDKAVKEDRAKHHEEDNES